MVMSRQAEDVLTSDAAGLPGPGLVTLHSIAGDSRRQSWRRRRAICSGRSAATGAGSGRWDCESSSDIGRQVIGGIHTDAVQQQRQQWGRQQ